MNERIAQVLTVGCAGLIAVGCGGTGPSENSARQKSAGREVRRATAWLNPTQDSTAHGSAIFIREGERYTLQVSLEDTPPGEHAVHIHENGDCSAEDGSSAGGHWNPTGVAHGRWGIEPFHLGDIGNVTVGKEGSGSLMLTTDLWAMGGGGDNDVLGRAVIVHAGADDFTTQPTGAAGGRIACGVIKD